jgi:hypothetical protein
MKNKQQKLLTDNYELSDNHLLRQLNHLRRMKYSTMGWYHSGPGLKNICILFIYHRLGRPIFRLHAWYQQQPRLQARINRFIPGR